MVSKGLPGVSLCLSHAKHGQPSKPIMKTSFIKKPALLGLTLSLMLAAASLPANALDMQHRVGDFYSASLHGDARPAAGGHQQLRVVMLRDVNAGEMADLFARGLVAHASDEEIARLVPVLFALGELLGQQKTLAAGDSLVIDGSAAKGMRISIQARGASLQPEQSFSQPGAFGVMQRMWLGARAI